MLQFKTTSIPNVPCNGVKKKEFLNGLTVETCNRALAPVGQAIQDEAKGGWCLHSITCLPQRVVRKKSILELLFGWIPILGDSLFPNMKEQCGKGLDFHMYVLVFVKEV